MKFGFFIFSFIITLQVYSQNHGVLSKNDSLIYTYHHTYDSFLKYLKDSIKKLDSDVERFSFVRRKAAEIIDIGFGGKDVSKISSHWTNFNARQYYSFFYKNIATVKCGGAAYFLKQTYSNLGYESHIYDMGCQDSYTHQVSLVKSNEDNLYYVQDAFLNVSFYEKNTSRYLPFDEMINYLKHREADLIQVENDSYGYGDQLDTNGVVQTLVNNGYSLKKSKRAAKRIHKMNRRKFVSLNDRFNRKIKKCLLENSWPKKSIYLYMLPQPHNLKRVFEIYNSALSND